MCKLSQRVVTGLLIIIIALAVPGIALSQQNDKPAADLSEKKIRLKMLVT